MLNLPIFLCIISFATAQPVAWKQWFFLRLTQPPPCRLLNGHFPKPRIVQGSLKNRTDTMNIFFILKRVLLGWFTRCCLGRWTRLRICCCLDQAAAQGPQSRAGVREESWRAARNHSVCTGILMNLVLIQVKECLSKQAKSRVSVPCSFTQAAPRRGGPDLGGGSSCFT